MIFKNRFINLPDGENLSLYVTDDGVVNLYLFNEKIKKKKLSLEGVVRTENEEVDFDCEKIIQLSDKHLCLCLDGNISIVEV